MSNDVRKKIVFIILFLGFITPLLSQPDFPRPNNFSNSTDVEFYPIGWSKSGNLAYMVYENYPFCCSYWVFKIQSTISDEVLYSTEFDGESNNYIDDPNQEWSLVNRRIKRYLDRYNIRPQREFKRFRYISMQSGFDYRVLYRKKNGPILEHVVENEVAPVGFRVKVYNDYGSKTVSNFKIKNAEYLSDVNLLGAIKSPFEERIAIITSFKIYDYQNDYAGTELQISGCKLNSGFK